MQCCTSKCAGRPLPFEQERLEPPHAHAAGNNGQAHNDGSHVHSLVSNVGSVVMPREAGLLGIILQEKVHGTNALARWLWRSASFRPPPRVRKSESYPDGVDQLPHLWLAS